MKKPRHSKLFCKLIPRIPWSKSIDAVIYRIENKARIKAISDACYIKNKKKLLIESKERYYKNRESILQKHAKYREKNKEKIKKWHYEYNKKNPMKKKIIKANRKIRELNAGKLSIETVQRVYEDNIKKYGTLTCYLCEKSIQFKNDNLEHKTPLCRGGTNLYENLAVACQGCNNKKHNKTPEEYKQFLYAITAEKG